MWRLHDYSVIPEAHCPLLQRITQYINMIIETLKTVIILPASNSNNFNDNLRMLIDRAMYTLIADCHAA